MKPLLVIGSGAAGYREYALSAMSARVPLVLLDFMQPTWQRPYLTDHVPVTADLDSMIEAARGYAAQHALGGVATYDERYVELAALLAEEWGLPGAGVAAVRACKDKWQTRQRLAASQPGAIQSHLAQTVAEAVQAATRIGPPVILKPRSLGGSIGVIIAGSIDEVPDAFQIAAAGHAPGAVLGYSGVLVEEYVTGDEYSVDSVVHDGRVIPLVMAAKTVGIEPYFEEVAHCVDATAEIPDPLTAFLQQVHETLGFSWGVTHTEFKTAGNGYRLIEVNARLGGDLIPYLGQLASGVDLAGAVAQLATGEAPSTDPRWRRTAGLRFVYPDHDITIERVEIPADLTGAPGHGVWARPLVQPGDTLRLPPADHMTRAAVVFAVGEGVDHVQELLDKHTERIRLHGQPPH